MVIAQNPDSFLSWPSVEKIRFYEKTIQWHQYVSRLMKRKEIIKAWGAQKLPGRVRPVATKTLLIALYRVTFDRFSELLVEDPLWNYGLYEAPILKPIEGDYEDDLERYNKQRAYLEAKLNKKLPKPILKYPNNIPKVKPGGNLEVLVTTKNSPGYEDLPDEEKLAIDEKVIQMHDYHRPLREAGIIVYEWGTYQNCGFGVTSGGVVAEGALTYKVNSYSEFDALFLADPIRHLSIVHTVVLVPFEESLRRAKQELKVARAGLKTR